MIIKSIRIENFRSFSDETIFVDRYAAFVGANGAGKSTILCALNIFFREGGNATTETTVLDAEDFHLRDTGKPISITVTFCDLDDKAKADFADYVRHDELVISAIAEFDPNTGKAPVLQFGQRRVIPEFANFFALEKNTKTKVGELKDVFLDLRTQFPEIAEASTRDAMRQALRAYEEARPDDCELLPSEDRFYGFSGGSDRLNKYVQWVYVPAVKDVTQENAESRNSALGMLLKRTVRLKVDFEASMKAIRDEARQKYRDAMKGQQAALDEISTALSKRLGEWSHPEATARLEWSEDEKRSVVVEEPTARMIAAEAGFEGEIARFGHGYQRSYLVALLQELAALNQHDAPTLILGFEEPELYQHPPQARHLADVLTRLGDNNAQALVTTHSPYFASGKHFENVFAVRRESSGHSKVRTTTADEVSKRIAKARGIQHASPPSAEFARLDQALNPQLSEMFFCGRVVFVEGIEDVAYLTAWFMLNGGWDAMRRAGAHIVPVGGKSNLVRPLAISELLQIPAFVVFDGDGDEQDPKKRKDHEADNKAILELIAEDSTAPFPSSSVFGKRHVQWTTEIGKVTRADVDSAAWDKAFGAARKELGNPTGDFSKSPLFVGALLNSFNKSGVSLNGLTCACEAVRAFVLDK
ncbi:MAG: ATP-dependent endonuclease [Proteobacteria bacterium]|nr:MAG: ATP-dependent endonuclease [Pseudomonadota bacterium]